MRVMEKKEKFRFTIGLNSKLPKHIVVAEFLNGMGKGTISQLIVDAVIQYCCLDVPSEVKATKKESKNDEIQLSEEDVSNLLGALDFFENNQ